MAWKLNPQIWADVQARAAEIERREAAGLDDVPDDVPDGDAPSGAQASGSEVSSTGNDG